MRRRYITVDVFTDRAFGGNPLAVVLDAEALSTAQMQAVAKEFNYSETTFVLPPRDAAHDAEVRIFTVNSEIPFAGHPNVGTAFVLASRAGKAKAALRSISTRAMCRWTQNPAICRRECFIPAPAVSPRIPPPAERPLRRRRCWPTSMGCRTAN